jgi:hypothetical protein
VKSAWVSFIFNWILAAFLGTSLLVLGIPIIRINRVWSAMSKAAQLRDSGRESESCSLLAPMEQWCLPYPSVRDSYRLHLIQSLAASGDIPGSREVAQKICEEFGSPRFPSSLLPWATSLPAPAVEYLVRLTWTPGRMDRWSGYRLLLDEMREKGLAAESASLAKELLGRSPDEATASFLAAFAADAPPRGTAPGSRPEPAVVAHVREPVPPGNHNVPEPAAPPPQPAVVTEGSSPPDAGMPWGMVTSVTARTYDPSGKPVRTVPQYYVMLVPDTRLSRSGTLAVCREASAGPANGPFYMKIEDVLLSESSLQDLDERTRTLVTERSGLAVRVYDTMERVRTSLNERNPYASSYRRALDSYRRYTAEVETLTKKRDESTGAARMKAMDDLRMMISKGADLSAAYNTAKANYDNWMAVQMPRSTPPDVAAMKERISTITVSLNRMGLQ